MSLKSATYFLLLSGIFVGGAVETYVQELEAEDGIYSGSLSYRGAASGGRTIHLSQSQHVTNTFTVATSCPVSIENVAYTNDGGSDTIRVLIDNTVVGTFTTIAHSNYGYNWNVVRHSGRVGGTVQLMSGSHQLRLEAISTDSYGVELDQTTLDVNCAPPPQCVATPAPPTSDDSQCSYLARATNNSTMTNCAEEDNINIPLFYYSGIHTFDITASLPQYYPLLTTLNYRDANFTGCTFTSKTIWEIGSDDASSTEFSASCSSSTYTIGKPFSEFCPHINEQAHNQTAIYFTTNGIGDGSVESSIGSSFTLKFSQVTGSGSLVVNVHVYGRAEKWMYIGESTFTSTELVHTWQIPDLTWVEGQGKSIIEMQVTDASSIDAAGYIDYLQLKQREESGESVPIKVYDIGDTLIEAITIDFWWLYPKGMTILNLQTGQEWYNVSYIRVYKKVPGTVSYSQLLVLYQDGNVRLLTFPPTEYDWIPFGSSVIIGPATSLSARPYASIFRVNIQPVTSSLEVHYDSGGMALLSLMYSQDITTLLVSGITYTTNSSVPFAVFRSMWVSEGNSDVDHIESWSILDGWTEITDTDFLFHRSCVSTHNTLSPDLRIVVECAEPSTPITTTKSSTISTLSTTPSTQTPTLSTVLSSTTASSASITVPLTLAPISMSSSSPLSITLPSTQAPTAVSTSSTSSNTLTSDVAIGPTDRAWGLAENIMVIMVCLSVCNILLL